MPRDGSNIYHRPPGTDGVPNTTIASTPYNGYVADVEQDLNLPRPIVAGGTGASDAVTAMTNLSGEIAKQVVTNYNTQTFYAGSFYSDNTTGRAAPVDGHAFIGICYLTDASNIVLEARDEGDTTTPGRKYVREKKAGVWGAWTVQAGSVADMDAAYVNVAGDAMTGALSITNSTGNPPLFLTGTVGSNNNDILSMKGGLSRWVIRAGGAGAESGGNAGSDFNIISFNDAGAALATPFSINRATGNLLASNQITVGSGLASATLFFSNVAGKYLNYDGSNFNVVGGNLIATAPTQAVNDNSTKLATTAYVDGVWTAYTPSFINGTATTVGRYRRVGKTCYINVQAVLTSVPTGNIGIGLPIAGGSMISIISGRELVATGKQVAGEIDPGTSVISNIRHYDNTIPANTEGIYMTGVYETA